MKISRWATALSVAAMALLTSCFKDEETKDPSVAVKYTVENGKVRFADFPIASLVAAVAGEEAAPGIAEQIGKVTGCGIARTLSVP